MLTRGALLVKCYTTGARGYSKDNFIATSCSSGREGAHQDAIAFTTVEEAVQ